MSELIEIARDSFPSPWSENLLRGEMTNPIARMLVGRVDRLPGKPVVGYVVYWQVADEMHLHNIAVRKDQRRNRVASLLLREAIRASQSEGARRVTLEVRRSNIAAQNLYGKFGFSVKGVRPRYYSDTGEDALIFWADLERIRPEGEHPSKSANKE
ncbi:MAG: ribosomal protein S18-alanine N-acetyltransferase [Deltaproteobacteria bacterium]|nr:ribosomal protein S18-alanine N-acetyltransferase [Deltaproteobacteria bacterium]